jgi:hypothetical protein
MADYARLPKHAVDAAEAADTVYTRQSDILKLSVLVHLCFAYFQRA